MSGEKIENIINYWNKNPVHSVEFKQTGDSKSYFESIDSLRWSDNERWAYKKFYEFGSGVGKRLLDAGCGIGVFTRFYAKKGFEVHAIDITQSGIEITKSSLEVFGLNARCCLGNVENIPYPDNYFDYIVSNGVIHHTPNTEQSVKEFYRVLKPGGIASICVYYKNILLRQPFWTFVKILLPHFLKKVKGREMLLSVRTPEEFVRVYDGNNTPIAKVYSRRQADELFKNFKFITVETHYFPMRFLRYFKVGGILHRWMDRYCGVLIYYLLEKPREDE